MSIESSNNNMKLQFTLLLSLICCATFGQKKYTLKPDAQGYLIIRGTYQPGDTLMLDGSFKAVAVYDLKGSIDKTITITNVPGKVLYIGDSTWSGGSWSHGLAIRNCRYLNVCGTTRNNFRITGSNSNTIAYGAPVRTAYFNLLIGELTEDIVVHDISIRHGGSGVSCKTDINAGSPRTYGSTPLSNFEFYNMDIYNTYNEGFYIGVTAATADAAGRFAVKLNNVRVHHNKLWHIGNDGIQIASSDNVEVNDNEITDWSVKKESSHCGGILIGGRISGFLVYNNRVTNGWGEMLQVFAEAGPALVRNNLFANNSLSAISIRGGKGLIVRFVRNTVALAGDYAIRINGAFGSTGKQLIDSNIIAQPGGGARYYYLENGGTMTDLNNKTFTTVTDAKLNTLLNYEPLVTSTARGYGYSSTTVVTPPDPEQPATKLTFSITLPIITLPEGTHTLKLTLPDGKVSDVKIVVQRGQ
jgi:hypothetical protein